MNMLEWAKKEVELAIANKEQIQECGYINACYASALKAFESLCDDRHNEMSIYITKSVLNYLHLSKILVMIFGIFLLTSMTEQKYISVLE